MSMELESRRDLPARWVRFERYELEENFIVGLGRMAMLDITEVLRGNSRSADTQERQPAFIAFARVTNPEEALEFARHFGLLGLFGRKYPWVARRDNEVIGFLNPWGVLLSPEEVADREGISLPSPAEMAGLIPGGFNALLLRRERVSEWLEEAEKLRGVLMASEKTSNLIANRNLASLYEQAVTDQELYGVRLGVGRSAQGLTLRWRFTSLLDGLWLQAAQEITGGKRIRLCAECGRLFLADDPRLQYCSESCRRRKANKKRSLKGGAKEHGKGTSRAR